MASRRYKFLPHLLQFRRVPFLHWGRIGRWVLAILMIAGFTAGWAYLFSQWWPTPQLKAHREAIQEKKLSLERLASYRDTVLRLTQEAEALEKELYTSLVPEPETSLRAPTAPAFSVGWPTEDTLEAYLRKTEAYLYQLARAEAVLQSPVIRSRWLPRRLPCACRELAVGFGQAHHPILGTPYPHRGIDFLVGEGALIRTTAEGVVIKVEPAGAGQEGTRVYVQHRPDLITVYYPVAAQVQVGQGLAAGTPLGTVQRVTLARAPFLHYEVWVRGEAVNPLPYLWGDLTWAEREKWKAAFSRQTHALH